MNIKTNNLSRFISEYASRHLRLYSWGSSGIRRLENIRDNPLKSFKEIKTLECGKLAVFLFDRLYWLTDGVKYQSICLERQDLTDGMIAIAEKEMHKEEYYA